MIGHQRCHCPGQRHGRWVVQSQGAGVTIYILAAVATARSRSDCKSSVHRVTACDVCSSVDAGSELRDQLECRCLDNFATVVLFKCTSKLFIANAYTSKEICKSEHSKADLSVRFGGRYSPLSPTPVVACSAHNSDIPSTKARGMSSNSQAPRLICCRRQVPRLGKYTSRQTLPRIRLPFLSYFTLLSQMSPDLMPLSSSSLKNTPPTIHL